MAITTLASRLSTLPVVLAGPILRRVTADTVTVWVALQASATVHLSVLDDKGNEVKTGKRVTVEIGTFLHIAAVTATTAPPYSGLVEGIVYQYKLVFDLAGKPGVDMATATQNAVLAYAPYKLPSFAMPPQDLNKVRLMCGSCRMPHGSGPDALPLLHALITQSASQALYRPHQLLLTGDQIYADDVAASLLLLLTDAGETLLGWGELLGPDKLTPASLPPYWRIKPLTAAKFTSDDLRSHLMSLGEYLSMYLFAWSDVLWPLALPTYDDVMSKTNQNGGPDIGVDYLSAKTKKIINGDTTDAKMFWSGLKSVRTVLANIPTYMICDDHEVTDDWNMTLGFCSGVYGNALGLQVVRNALVAYSFCQHWGNVPEQFDDSGQVPAGLTLLRLLDTVTAQRYIDNTPRIQTIIGLHDFATQQKHANSGVFHDQSAANWMTINGLQVSGDSLTYNYTIEAPGHQVIVTDTRTWRAYPDGDNSTAEFLPKDQLQEQITNTPALGDRALLVVLTTNAPPTEPLRSASVHSTLTGLLGDSQHPDIYDAWDLPSIAYDRLLARLTDKLPKKGGSLWGRVILISGDVHHGFASRMIYRATKRYEDTVATPATAVFAQLVASSLKKQNKQTVALQDDGYAGPGYAKSMIPPHMEEGYVGWNSAVGQVLGSKMVVVFGRGMGASGPMWVPLKQGKLPTILLTKLNEDYIPANPARFKFTIQPDYEYRLDYLVATAQATEPASPPTIPPIPAGATAADRQQAANLFNTATSFYRANRNAGTTQEIVGVNNIGEITFNWGADDAKQVSHTLRWVNAKTLAVQFTTYTVSLDPGDTKYPDVATQG